MEAKLQSLKVPELKDLLTKASLPVTGNKPDLIKRLLENPSATSSLGDAEAPAPETEAAPSAPEEPAAPAAETPTPAATTEAAEAPVPQALAAAESPDQEARKRMHLAELEKRKARAIRFGQSTEELEKEIARVTKFGLPEGEADATQKIDHGLRTGKRAQPAAQAGPTKQAKTEAKAPAAPAVSVGDVANVQEEELERRKRRAERFGLVDPAEEEKKRQRAERFNVRSRESDAGAQGGVST